MTSKCVTNITFLKKYLSSTLHKSTNFLKDTMKFFVYTCMSENNHTSFLTLLFLSCSYIKYRNKTFKPLRNSLKLSKN